MKSVWSETVKFDDREALKGDMETEVVVIGAGIAGLLTAYMLKNKGVNVIVIERNKIASGNIKNTTAKITSQHDLIYDKLITEFGEEKANQYAVANEFAIQTYRKIIMENKVDCDFKEKSAYLYSLDDTKKLEDEFKAAVKLGINAELTEKIDLPLDTKLALKFKNQAQFNPLKFLSYISKDLTIYEDTKAIDVEENLVITNKGKIRAKHIVIATHFPIVNVPGYYFMRMHQERSYVLALQNAQELRGMYIDIDKKGLSFRSYNNLLLLGGISQRTGENESGSGYDSLRKIAKKLYPNAEEKYHWSSQDCMTIDSIPYIGRYSDKTPNMYVATGFNKWGMTSAMVGSMIISDMILGKKNEFQDIFSPSRFDMSLSISNLMHDGAETAKNFIAQKLYIPENYVKNIEKNHGGVVDYDNKKVGVYRSEKDEIFFVSTKCPHLGCELHWNQDELSWDCPCHGSRFDYKGNWLDAPAIKEPKYE